MPGRGKNQLSHQIAHVLQDLAVWDTLSSSECKEVALFVAASLPSTFHFARIETYGAGQQRHHMALFEWQESSQQSSSLFVLIPGSTVTLGYDQTRISIPDEQFIREWLEYLEDGEVERAILPADVAAFSAYVKEKLLPLRTTTLQPFLLETVAQEASLLLPPPVMTYHRFKAPWQGQVPVKYFLSDPYRRWSRLDSFDRGRYHVIPHRHVVAFLKQQGLRLPSSDEWEYACAAGSHTLFYWGNWEFLMKENAPVPYALPNAFGLSIANNPYQREYCSDPTVMRGGDGGGAFCGAEGELASHLPLASAYVYLCWLLVVSVGQKGPLRTPNHASCSLPILQRESTISSIHLLIFTKGEWTLCRGFPPSSRALYACVFGRFTIALSPGPNPIPVLATITSVPENSFFEE